MIGVELSMEIRVLAKHGKGVREIAREVGVSRNTARRYLRDPEAVRHKGLLDEIRALGYAGGYTMVKAFVASLRPPAEPEPVLRFETAPARRF